MIAKDKQPSRELNSGYGQLWSSNFLWVARMQDRTMFQVSVAIEGATMFD